MTVRRSDVSTSPAFRRTPQGGLFAKSRPTRVGILEYIYPNGKKVRELRPESEVFHPDSLASLAGAPLTVGHPRGGVVNASNWTSLSKGHVGDEVKQDGTFVDAPVRVQDEDTSNRCERGELPEMSCGYTADMDDTPGVWNGQKYDSIQRNIRYNHVALLPRNTGRAGPEVGIRLDGQEDPDAAIARLDSQLEDSPLNFEVSDPKDKADPAPQQVLDAKDFVSRVEFDRVSGELAGIKSQLETANKQKQDALDATSPAKLDKLASERQALIESARSLHPEIKTDGLTAHEIRVAALKHGAPAIKVDGESEAFVQGVFAGQAVNAKAVSEAHKKVQDGKPAPHTDSTGGDKVSAAKAAYLKRMSEQFKAN